ncbi:CIC11C00000002264 [Sungouiella intermedia]|uniref:5-formyltetrahydrofolate cyclo-ligase n=1 Tax=Sungouiella intermedia TaxID=45354 RepID=A0A1L0B8I3_9ASCO|nr:CIC11C00000002264 [[Candida] intermedia]
MSNITKKALRKHVLTRLANLTPESVSRQSSLVFRSLRESPEFQQANSIGLYMNMPTMEIHTQDIIKLCFDLNKKVFLPKCVDTKMEGRRLRHLRFLSLPTMESVLSLKPSGKYNLREPQEGEDAMESGQLDLLIVPGVAFSLTGQRLGHGAGYYDEFLQAFNSKFGRTPYLLGLSLQEQIVDHIPMESHDWHLNKIVSASDNK